MSIAGPNIFVPNGPRIPSDSLTSKSKSSSTFVDYKFVLPNFSTAVLTLPEQITDPAPGMMVFNTFTSKLNFYDGTNWQVVTSV